MMGDPNRNGSPVRVVPYLPFDKHTFLKGKRQLVKSFAITDAPHLALCNRLIHVKSRPPVDGQCFQYPFNRSCCKGTHPDKLIDIGSDSLGHPYPLGSSFAEIPKYPNALHLVVEDADQFLRPQ